MAQKTITQRIAFDGGPEMEIQLKQIGDSGQVAFRRLQSAAETSQSITARLIPVLEAVKLRIQEVGKAADHVKTSFDNFGQSIETSARRVALAGAAAAAAGAGFFALVKGASDAADAVAKTAEFLGITTQQLQGLQFVAGQSGIETEKLTKGLSHLVAAADISEKKNLQLQVQQQELLRSFGAGTISLDEYAAGLLKLGQTTTTNVIDPFHRLGISVRQADGTLKDTFTLLNDLAEAFHNSNDGALKAQILYEAFGARVGSRFANALNKGRQGIADLVKEQERIAPAFTKAELAIGVQFSDALDRLERAFLSVKNSFLLTFAPAFTEGFNILTELIANNRQAIVDFGQVLATRFKSIVEDVFAILEGRDQDVKNSFILKARDAVVEFASDAKQAIGIIVAAWGDFVAILNTVANIINAVFGTKLTGQTLAIVAVLGVLSGAFSAIGAAISVIIALIGAFDAVLVVAFGPEGALFAGLVLLASAIGALIGQIPSVQSAFDALVDGFHGTVAAFVALFQLIGTAWDAVWQNAEDFVGGVYQTVIGWIESIIAKITEAANAVKSFFASSNSDQSTPSGFAQGGAVRGPGTQRSDSIVARLSNGEFVHQAPAVQYYGERFMHALNRMQIPRNIVDGLAGFAQGGFVRSLSALAPVPGFAHGGLVSSDLPSLASAGGRPLVLHIGDEVFTGMTAEDKTADKLSRFATRRHIQSAGRKPAWVT